MDPVWIILNLSVVCKGTDQNPNENSNVSASFYLFFFPLFLSFIHSRVLKRALALPVSRGFTTMDHLGAADAEDDSGSLTRLAPSPHSEAVAHEFKELSLQPSQYLPPLNERKNGECTTDCSHFCYIA